MSVLLYKKMMTPIHMSPQDTQKCLEIVEGFFYGCVIKKRGNPNEFQIMEINGINPKTNQIFNSLWVSIDQYSFEVNISLMYVTDGLCSRSKWDNVDSLDSYTMKGFPGVVEMQQYGIFLPAGYVKGDG